MGVRIGIFEVVLVAVVMKVMMVSLVIKEKVVGRCCHQW